VEVQSVDPRYASGEIGRPAYRVDFWGQVGAPVGDEDATVSDEYLLPGAAEVREGFGLGGKPGRRAAGRGLRPAPRNWLTESSRNCASSSVDREPLRY
jgi:hypothetical protein